jgi:hypothetical protein
MLSSDAGRQGGVECTVEVYPRGGGETGLESTYGWTTAAQAGGGHGPNTCSTTSLVCLGLCDGLVSN